MPKSKWTTDNTTIETWFERDRRYVGLSNKAMESKDQTKRNTVIIEWWDEDITQLVEDGFLDSKRWHESAVEYANEICPPTTHHYTAFDHKEWSKAGLEDFEKFSEMVEYINQTELGDGTLEGEWYYCDDESMTIYHGTHGNDNSPGASCYTYATVFDDVGEYEAESLRLEMCDEYVETAAEEVE